MFKIKKLTTSLLLIGLLASCSDGTSEDEVDSKNENNQEKPSEESSKTDETSKMIEEGKGVGEVKNVDLTDPLDEEMIAEGREVYETKCASCHKLGDKRFVGPGFKGVTNKRKPEWIMNMITNPELMIRKDPTAMELLKEYSSPMANQNVSVEKARSILEFLRNNDLETVGSKDEAVK